MLYLRVLLPKDAYGIANRKNDKDNDTSSRLKGKGLFSKGYNVGWFLWLIFCIFFKKNCCFVVAIFDPVHNLETLFHLP